jgi:RNA polymerase sigma-70 factor (ECF subfamily)
VEVTEISDIVSSYGKDVYNFCRQLTRNKEEADELYQDTFLRTIELCYKIDRGNNPRSFLLSIALRLWKNRRRKFSWRNRIAAVESYRDESSYCIYPAESAESPEEELLEKEKTERIVQAVKRLREEYQSVVYLYYTAEMPLKEISVILHLPEGTVKSRLHKARNAVGKILEEYLYG